MQECNVNCLPENYQVRKGALRACARTTSSGLEPRSALFVPSPTSPANPPLQAKYWMYHALTWPALQYVADAGDGKIVGYVLAKIDDEDPTKELHGHITSLAVKRSYRKTGLATKLMTLSQRSMVEMYGAKFVSLHVRETNFAAYHLYKHTLKFEQHGIEAKYYADGENAYDMRRQLSRELFRLGPKPGSPEDLAAKARALEAAAAAKAEAALEALLADEDGAGGKGKKDKAAKAKDAKPKKPAAAAAPAAPAPAAGGKGRPAPADEDDEAEAGGRSSGAAAAASAAASAAAAAAAEAEDVEAAFDKAGAAADLEPGEWVVASAAKAMDDKAAKGKKGGGGGGGGGRGGKRK